MQDNEKNDTRLLNEALAKAQAEIRNATVNKENAFVGSKYADLGSIWDACRKPLTDNDLAVVQLPETIDGEIVLRTILLHSSGQSIEGFLPLSVFGIKDAHSLGSAFTYARRYSLSAMVGCAPEGDDDDGNQAQTHGGKKTPARKTRMPKAKKAEDERTLAEKAEGILLQVPEADAWLRLKDVDPGDPPAPVCERIVTLGADGLRKTIADDKKKQEKAEKEEDAAKIVDAADKAEPIEDEKEDEKEDEVAA